MPTHEPDPRAPERDLSLLLSVRVKEACRLTGIGRSKIYLLMREGRLESVKVGSMTLIPVRSLRALLEPRGQ
jgi:excisionase family DNA binding protein